MWKALFEVFASAVDFISGLREENRQKAIDVYKRKHQEAREEIAAMLAGTDADLAAGKAEIDKLKDGGPGGPTHL